MSIQLSSRWINDVTLSDVLLPVALFKMPSMHLQARWVPWGWKLIHLHEWWNHMDVSHLLMPLLHPDLQDGMMALKDVLPSSMHSSRCFPDCSSARRCDALDGLCTSVWCHFEVPAYWCPSGCKRWQSPGTPLMTNLPGWRDQHVLLCPWLMQRSTWCSLMSPNMMHGMGCDSPKEILDATWMHQRCAGWDFPWWWKLLMSQSHLDPSHRSCWWLEDDVQLRACSRNWCHHSWWLQPNARLMVENKSNKMSLAQMCTICFLRSAKMWLWWPAMDAGSKWCASRDVEGSMESWWPSWSQDASPCLQGDVQRCLGDARIPLSWCGAKSSHDEGIASCLMICDLVLMWSPHRFRGSPGCPRQDGLSSDPKMPLPKDGRCPWWSPRCCQKSDAFSDGCGDAQNDAKRSFKRCSLQTMISCTKIWRKSWCPRTPKRCPKQNRKDVDVDDIHYHVVSCRCATIWCSPLVLLKEVQVREDKEDGYRMFVNHD